MKSEERTKEPVAARSTPSVPPCAHTLKARDHSDDQAEDGSLERRRQKIGEGHMPEAVFDEELKRDRLDTAFSRDTRILFRPKFKLFFALF
jgi:hypothetical protein